MEAGPGAWQPPWGGCAVSQASAPVTLPFPACLCLYFSSFPLILVFILLPFLLSFSWASSFLPTTSCTFPSSVTTALLSRSTCLLASSSAARSTIPFSASPLSSISPTPAFLLVLLLHFLLFPDVPQMLVGIRVLDINDNDPVLLNLPMNITISENIPVSSFVTRILASDADSGCNALLTFNITAGNRERAFSINATVGLGLTPGKPPGFFLKNRTLPQGLFYSAVWASVGSTSSSSLYPALGCGVSVGSMESRIPRGATSGVPVTPRLVVCRDGTRASVPLGLYQDAQEVLARPLGVLPAAVTVGSSEGPSLSGSKTWALVGRSCSGKALLVHFGPPRPYLW